MPDTNPRQVNGAKLLSFRWVVDGRHQCLSAQKILRKNSENSTKRIVGKYDKGENEREIFSIQSSAHSWASVIFAGKRYSRRHYSTGFYTGASYQMSEVLSFRDRQGAIKVTVLSFLVKNVK